MFTVADLEAAAKIVHAAMPPTPQYAWPLLKRRTGVDVVLKHENHTPTGAFKVRGGLVYAERLQRERPHVKGVITATRGNHGQSLAFACGRAGVACTVVAPFGNSTEKNAAMKAFGAELIEHGRDFDEARERAVEIAAERGYEYGKSFDRDLVLGVSTYAYELFTAEPELDAVYVPIGLGSGVCGVIAARDALKCKARVIGVISDRANTYRLSLDAGRCVPTNSALTFADGVAVRVPDEEALAIMQAGMERLDRRHRRRNRGGDPRALLRHAHPRRGRGRHRIRGADARARAHGRQTRCRHRVRAEHRPAVDADRAGGRNAGGGLSPSASSGPSGTGCGRLISPSPRRCGRRGRRAAARRRPHRRATTPCGTRWQAR